MIGHSLGAHTAAYVAKSIPGIGRITGEWVSEWVGGWVGG